MTISFFHAIRIAARGGGITVADVLCVFPGAKIIRDDKPRPIRLAQRCKHCSKSKELEGAPAWRRHGKIVPRTWPDGRVELGCHYCGRPWEGR
jgi:hypothetical protein